MLKILTDRLYIQDIEDIDDKADFIAVPGMLLLMVWGVCYFLYQMEVEGIPPDTWWVYPAVLTGLMTLGPLAYWVSYHVATIILFFIRQSQRG